MLETPDHSKLAHLWTDVFFTCPMRATLAARHRHLAPTWYYWFTATPSCPASEVGLRARHTAELFSVFGLKEDLPPPSGNCSMTQVGAAESGRKTHEPNVQGIVKSEHRICFIYFLNYMHFFNFLIFFLKKIRFLNVASCRPRWRFPI